MSTNSTAAQKRQPIRRWLIFGGVFLGLAIAMGLRFWFFSPEPVSDPVRVKAWERVEPHLKDADASEAKIVERQLDSIREFFNERQQQGVTPYVEAPCRSAGNGPGLKER